MLNISWLRIINVIKYVPCPGYSRVETIKWYTWSTWISLLSCRIS